MKIRKKHSTAKRVFVTAIIIASVSLLSVVVWYIYQQVGSENTAKAPAAVEKTIPQPVSLKSDVLTTGNIFWGRYINDWAMASPLKYEYPFSRLNEFDRDKYDAWIAGLECPTKSGVNMTSAEMEAALQFNCSPEYLPEAAKWFDIFSLANNHTDNQGIDGFAETQEALDKNGIQYFGHYDPRALSDICEVVSLSATITNNDNSTTKGSLPVALCGYHGVFRIPPIESLELMEKYSDIMPVISFPHMGVEYEPAPDELKTRIYRSMVDHGADMVIGDHPHWIQNTESYKGHLIVYSMGNFMFDQQDTLEVVRSAAIHILIQSNDADKSQLAKWLALGDKCKSYHDTCLEQAESEGLTKLPLTYQFGVVGSSDANKITKPATKAEQESILKRLNWQSTMDQLQPPYSSL